MPRIDIPDQTTPLAAEDLAKIGSWLLSHDTGISSLTIVAIAMGAAKAGGWGFDAPHDWSDFGRCKRLVARIPALRAHLPAVAATVPAFAGIVERWDELCALHARPSDEDSSAFYRRIRELRGDR